MSNKRWDYSCALQPVNYFKFSVPIIDLGGADELVGTVREDRTIVDVIPKLDIVHETGQKSINSISNKNE